MFFKSKPLVATHSSHFHPDDVCAVAVLDILLDGKYKLIRTRDLEMIKKADYVVDVGGIHDPKTNRFDHHQNGGAGKRENGAPYAAFGLVWKEFGEKLCGSKIVADKIDGKIVQPGDAMDNGINLVTPNIKDVYPYDFSDFLFSFNPTWNEDEKLRLIHFKKAVSYAVIMLKREIERKRQSEIGKEFTKESYQKAKDKRVVELSGSYPWREVLADYSEPLFVVYQNPEDRTWSAKSVPVNKDLYENRKQFPVSWGGKSGADLAAVTGVLDATFCHNGRFLVVAKSREGALKLAQLALESKE